MILKAKLSVLGPNYLNTITHTWKQTNKQIMKRKRAVTSARSCFSNRHRTPVKALPAHVSQAQPIRSAEAWTSALIYWSVQISPRTHNSPFKCSSHTKFEERQDLRCWFSAFVTLYVYAIELFNQVFCETKRRKGNLLNCVWNTLIFKVSLSLFTFWIDFAHNKALQNTNMSSTIASHTSMHV